MASNTHAAPARSISLDEYCMEKNRRRELVGAGVGGAVGAIAGKKLLGGTKGTIAGAALGGTAGYAAGDATIDCQMSSYQSPASTAPTQVAPAQTYSSGTYSSQTYSASSTASPTGQAYNAGQMSGTPGYQLYLQEQAAATPVGQASHTQQPVQTYGQTYTQEPVQTYSHVQTQTSAHTGSAATAQGQSYRQQHSHSQVGVQSAPTPSPRTATSGPRPVNYDYSLNTVTAGGGPAAPREYNVPVRQPAAPQPLTTPQSHSAPSAGYFGGAATSANYVGGQGNYTVKQGDTVYSLSRQRCIPVNEFSRINGLGSDYAIQIDQPLILPPSRC